MEKAGRSQLTKDVFTFQLEEDGLIFFLHCKLKVAWNHLLLRGTLYMNFGSRPRELISSEH